MLLEKDVFVFVFDVADNPSVTNCLNQPLEEYKQTMAT
jgi:hypothetical protein